MRLPLAHYWRLLSRYLRSQRRRVVLLAVLLCGSIALQLLNPQVLGAFINTAASHGSQAHLVEIALLFIGVALAQQGLALAATYFSERIGWTATNALRVDLTLHLLRLDLQWHKSRTPGELIERVDGDVTALANFFSQLVVQIGGNLLLLAGVLVVLWVESWLAGLLLTLFALIVLASMIKLRAIAVPYWTAARQASAALFGFLEERLAGTSDIRANGAQPYVMRGLYGAMRERLRTGSKARVVSTIGWSVPVMFFACGNALAFVLAAYLYQRHALSLGAAFLLYYYTQLLFQPLNLIANQLDDFQKASAGIARIGELFGTQSALDDGGDGALPVGALAVEFRDVTFGYGDDAPVLQDLSFRIEPGTVLGLLGRTGSGKSTIARLLLRLYDPAAGAVVLGDVDLRATPLAGLRRHIGMVTQEVQLFRATVRDNLTFFDPNIDDERIMAALAELGLDGWCRALPQGLDTMLGAGGSGLSAGEAQLLAFARVFLKDPGLVILDEASSRLDPATERLIERAVDRLLAGRTGIIIAHRLRTIERVDTVMILEDGRIREQGARTALAADPRSRLAHLLRTGLEELPA
ncbi:MAG TPA: ABC transporter ATP-binding protein [Chloroflexota bacterium]|nr:ABC transporter ATP-binding protein [Chloroflexota bacterium]